MSFVHTSKYPSAGKFPDDLDIYSFIFEYYPPTRADLRKSDFPMLIDEETGETRSWQQVKNRVDALSLGLQEAVGVQWDTVVGFFSANAMDWPTALWASHRLGAVVSPANPAFRPQELKYQLESSKATHLVLNEDAMKTGFEAAESAGIRRDRIVIVQSPKSIADSKKANGGKTVERIDGAWSLEGLVERGQAKIKSAGASALSRRTLKAGEGKKKLAFLSFSSGTTGLPKGVAIQHAAPIANVLQTMAFNLVSSTIGAEQGRFRAGRDISMGILPLFHIYGLVVGLHFVFYAGLTNVIVPRFRGIEAMLQSIVKYRCSHWWLVPPQIVLMCKDPSAKKYIKDASSVGRFCMVGAAPLSDDLSKQFGKVFPQLDWGQGYAETCTVTVMHPVGLEPVLGSAGRLFSDTKARVVTPEGKDLKFDEPGELWIQGPQNTLGYSNNAKATAEMFLEGNWVRTGDEVIFNKDGDIFVVDRLKELIKVKGFQVPPAELEGFLLDHPDVSDSGVIGIPDEEAGERPLAFVALSDDAKKRVKGDESGGEEKKVREGVVRFVAENKVKYKHLFDVQVIDAIPKTPSGKILRKDLRVLAKELGHPKDDAPGRIAPRSGGSKI